jgi:hypothetical protein
MTLPSGNVTTPAAITVPPALRVGLPSTFTFFPMNSSTFQPAFFCIYRAGSRSYAPGLDPAWLFNFHDHLGVGADQLEQLHNTHDLDGLGHIKERIERMMSLDRDAEQNEQSNHCRGKLKFHDLLSEVALFKPCVREW